MEHHIIEMVLRAMIGRYSHKRSLPHRRITLQITSQIPTLGGPER